MSDTSLNKLLGSGDDAAEAAFTPNPATGLTPEQAVLYVNTEDPADPRIDWWDGANFISTKGAAVPGFTFIEGHTIAAAATQDFDATISATYVSYYIDIPSLTMSNNTAALQLLVSTDGGSTYLTAGYISALSGLILSSAAGGTATSTSGVLIVNSYGTGVTRGRISGNVQMMNPADATNNKIFLVDIVAPISDGNWYRLTGGCVFNSASPVTDFQIAVSAGTMSGIVNAYGKAQ